MASTFFQSHPTSSIALNWGPGALSQPSGLSAALTGADTTGQVEQRALMLSSSDSCVCQEQGNTESPLLLFSRAHGRSSALTPDGSETGCTEEPVVSAPVHAEDIYLFVYLFYAPCHPSYVLYCESCHPPYKFSRENFKIPLQSVCVMRRKRRRITRGLL